MTNYLLVYHGGTQPPPEEFQNVIAAWGRWYDELGDAVVDTGNPTGQSRTIGGSAGTTNGGGANPVTGYSIVQAESLDAAVKLAQGCPHLKAGGTIEVCETFRVM